jgi:hypothetical protein
LKTKEFHGYTFFMSQDRNQHMRFALEALRDSLDANNFQPLERGLGIGKVRRSYVRPTRRQLDETKAVEIMSGAATTPVTQEIQVDHQFSHPQKSMEHVYSGRAREHAKDGLGLVKKSIRFFLGFVIDLAVISITLLNVCLVLEFSSSLLVGERLGLFSILSKVQHLTPMETAKVFVALVVCYSLYRAVFKIFSTQTIGINFVASRFKKHV